MDDDQLTIIAYIPFDFDIVYNMFMKNCTRKRKREKTLQPVSLTTLEDTFLENRSIYSSIVYIVAASFPADATGCTINKKISDLWSKIAVGLSDYLCAPHLVWFHCYEKSITRRTVLRCKNMCISIESESKLEFGMDSHVMWYVNVSLLSIHCYINDEKNCRMFHDYHICHKLITYFKD